MFPAVSDHHMLGSAHAATGAVDVLHVCLFAFAICHEFSLQKESEAALKRDLIVYYMKHNTLLAGRKEA